VPTDYGTFAPLDSLADAKLASEPVKNMLNRYALERHTGVFGLYLGDEQDGEVHTLHPGG